MSIVKKKPIENISITFSQLDRKDWKVGGGVGIDYVLFLLNKEGTLSHPEGIVFFNQPKDNISGISMEDNGTDVIFSIDLEKIRQNEQLSSIIDSFLFVVAIDEKCTKTAKDLHLKETIVLKDGNPEPKILHDTYEGSDTNQTLFLSRLFITDEGRLGKKEIRESRHILLPQFFPLLMNTPFEQLLETLPLTVESKEGSIREVSITFSQLDRKDWKVGGGVGIDYVLFLLNKEGTLSHPEGIVFFNQPKDNISGISMEDNGTDVIFSIDLEKIRQNEQLSSIIDSFLFVVAIDEKCTKTAKDLHLKETIVLKDGNPEPKILHDTYEGSDTNQTLFLSRLFITDEGRLGKKEIRESRHILLTQFFPLLEKETLDVLMATIPKESDDQNEGYSIYLEDDISLKQDREQSTDVDNFKEQHETSEEIHIDLSGGVLGDIDEIIRGLDIEEPSIVTPKVTNDLWDDNSDEPRLTKCVSTYQFEQIYIAFPESQIYNLHLKQRGNEEKLLMNSHVYDKNCSLELVQSNLNSLQVEIYFEVKP